MTLRTCKLKTKVLDLKTLQFGKPNLGLQLRRTTFAVLIHFASKHSATVISHDGRLHYLWHTLCSVETNGLCSGPISVLENFDT